jgi:hypothetical protein
MMPRFLVYLTMLLLSMAALAAQDEVEVDFDGDEEIVAGTAQEDEGEEEEVVFDDEGEEEDGGEGEAVAPEIPEVETRTWLLVFPVACIALLAFNVRWRVKK